MPCCSLAARKPPAGSARPSWGTAAADGVNLGTAFWQPPELVCATARRMQDEPLDLACCDVFAVGVLCWEVVERASPCTHFQRRVGCSETGPALVSALVSELACGYLPAFSPTAAPDLRSLAERCWAEPRARPTSSEVRDELLLGEK